MVGVGFCAPHSNPTVHFSVVLVAAHSEYRIIEVLDKICVEKLKDYGGLEVLFASIFLFLPCFVSKSFAPAFFLGLQLQRS